jgi:collagenase-like PrtC family protease
LVGNIGYIDKLIYLKNKYNIELIADYSLNISNTYSALFFQNQGFDYITPSVEINKSMLKEMLKYANIEVIDDYISVMSSRYCIVGSFVSNREKGNKCSMDCIKSKYILKDSYNEDYNLVFNNIDCTMNIVKKYENNQKIDENIRVRNSTI